MALQSTEPGWLAVREPVAFKLFREQKCTNFEEKCFNIFGFKNISCMNSQISERLRSSRFDALRELQQ